MLFVFYLYGYNTLSIERELKISSAGIYVRACVYMYIRVRISSENFE